MSTHEYIISVDSGYLSVNLSAALMAHQSIVIENLGHYLQAKMLGNLHSVKDPPRVKSSIRLKRSTSCTKRINRKRRGDTESSLLCRLKSCLPSNVPNKMIQPPPIIVNIGALSRSVSKQISRRFSFR